MGDFVLSVSKRLFVGVLALVFVCAADQAAFAVGKKLVGSQAPEISVSQCLNAKEKLSLNGSKGRVVLLEFWATWCPPCRRSIPHLEELHNNYAKKGLRVISVTAENARTVRNFMKKTKMSFPVAIDNNRKTNKAYGIRSIPTAYLIDVNGKVLWEGHTMQLKASQVEQALKSVKLDDIKE